MTSVIFAALVVQSAPTVSVDGEGWMRLSRDGRTVLARSGQIVATRGRLGIADATFIPPISVGSSTAWRVTRDGTVFGSLDGQEIALGKLNLVRFDSSATFSPVGPFSTSPQRGVVASPGQDGLGWFKSGAAPTPSTRPPTVLSQSVNAPNIRVRAESIVDAKTFTLGDIADLKMAPAIASEIAQIVVGDVPPLGMTRKVDRERIMVRLRVSGFDPNALSIEVPVSAIVKRPSQSIEHQILVNAAVAQLQSQVGAQAEIRDLNPMPPLVIAPGEYTVHALSPSLSNERAVVRVEVRVGGLMVNSRTLQLGIANRIALPKVGTMVTVRTRSGGVRVQFSAKVTSASPQGQIEVQTAEGTKLIGTLAEPGVVEIKL